MLLEDLLGLHVGLVTDHDRLEQSSVGAHRRDGRERQWRNKSRVAECMRSLFVAVCDVVVLDRARILAYLLATDQIGLIDLVVVAESVGDRRGICGS